MRRTDTWNVYSEAQLTELEKICTSYKRFLDCGKTERECVKETVRLAREAGYVSLEEARAAGKTLTAGSKVYEICMNKMIVLFHIGREPLERGMRILGAHIDSPRLDVKQNPLYEEGGIAYLDTHYYGGIKKYQWPTIPLALHGVVVKKNGETVDVRIGEDADDPIVFISDLLIHLAGEQMEKKARAVIDGENMDVVVGSRPWKKEDHAEAAGGEAMTEGNGNQSDGGTAAAGNGNRPDGRTAAAESGNQSGGGTAAGNTDQPGSGADGFQEKEDCPKGKEKNLIKENILQILKEKYGIEEEDFLSAEIEIVPAGKARDCGLDRSMILSYGQDDRVCAYTSLLAQLETDTQERTCCCLLVDKEETGSVGATSMKSRFFENTVAEIMDCAGQYSELKLRRCLANSSMLSSDVSAAFDPMFAGCFEKKNTAYLGKGLTISKYTGARGKRSTNDANAEYIAEIRRIFEQHDVAFQTAELGRVDVGGGGTISYITALYGMDVIDSGVPVMNMHAPMEVTSKADVYEAKRGYQAFLMEA